MAEDDMEKEIFVAFYCKECREYLWDEHDAKDHEKNTGHKVSKIGGGT